MNLIWETIKLIVVLGIVLIGIVYVIKFGLVRLQPEYYQRKGSLTIVERLPLSQKNGLFLVRAGEKYLLLGVSAENINMLTEISSDEIQAAQAPAGSEFKQYLDNCINGNRQNASIKEKIQSFISKQFHGGYSDERKKDEE